jgi:hypothetical protein
MPVAIAPYFWNLRSLAKRSRKLIPPQFRKKANPIPTAEHGLAEHSGNSYPVLALFSRIALCGQ